MNGSTGLSPFAPSRYHLALFRLGAFLRLRFGGRSSEQTTELTFQPGQSALEVYLTATLVYGFITLSWLGLFHLDRPFGSWLALTLPLSLVLTYLSLHAAAVGTALILLALRTARVPVRENLPIQSAVMMTLLLVTAVVLWRLDSWMRWVGLFWLALAALDAFAAVVLLLFRRQVNAIEQRFGGPASERQY